jgi:16S rRNA processing protein RimM
LNSAERWIAVGRVGRPHGLGGAFVVEDASEAPERLAPGARVYVRGESAAVVEAKRAGGRLVVKLDRPVERGAALEVPASDLPEPEDDAFYVFQLVGLAVEEESGQSLGRVDDVAPGVANDVLELDSGISLPLVAECVRSVDLARRRIVVAPGYADHGHG